MDGRYDFAKMNEVAYENAQLRELNQRLARDMNILLDEVARQGKIIEELKNCIPPMRHNPDGGTDEGESETHD